MKKHIFTLVLLSIFVCANAQHYLRYHMNDGSFNGFYTEYIEKITHETINGKISTSIYTQDKIYEIPLNTIDSVSLENVSIEKDSDYRLYECNFSTGRVKKIYVDNRATLLASCNGDFGANDTIVFSSAYHGIKWLLITNKDGLVKKIFDGKKLFFFDYDNNGGFSILDLYNNEIQYFHTNDNDDTKAKSTRAINIVSCFLKPISKNETTNLIGGVGLGLLNNFAGNIDVINNDPEKHHQKFVVDGLSITGDLIALSVDAAALYASILAGGVTSGWAIASLVTDVCFLLNDLSGLLNDIWPDSEQMKIYKDYYKDKYSISLRVLPAEDKSLSSAKLCGELESKSELKPECSFLLYGIKDEIINGQTTNSSENLYKITGSANNLTPGSIYFYYVTCTYTVDGLELTYKSDSYSEFYTPMPQIETDGYQNNGPQSTTIHGSCIYDWDSYFETLAEPKVGFAYSADGSNWEFVKSNLGFDGNFSANLLDIDCMTSYRYKAYVEIDGTKHYGNEKYFSSAPPSIDGIWICTDSSSDHEDSYTISISGNYATWSNTMNEGGEVWFSGSCDANFTIAEKWVSTSTSVFWNTWAFTGTLNDKNHPTSISGKIVHSTGNWLHSNESIYSFTMTK